MLNNLMISFKKKTKLIKNYILSMYQKNLNNK